LLHQRVQALPVAAMLGRQLCLDALVLGLEPSDLGLQRLQAALELLALALGVAAFRARAHALELFGARVRDRARRAGAGGRAPATGCLTSAAHAVPPATSRIFFTARSRK